MPKDRKDTLTKRGDRILAQRTQRHTVACSLLSLEGNIPINNTALELFRAHLQYIEVNPRIRQGDKWAKKKKKSDSFV